ncbi:MAG TPA: YdbL family protein [Gammaproteobacteria bacterium]|nr:YdbL family protein [Gammaproteobacteria bacterium]
MRKMKRVLGLLWLPALAACVTVNVYFPAAAVEQAADRIVKEVYGVKAGQQKQQEEKKQEPAGDKRSDAAGVSISARSIAMLDWMIAPALAQAPDIDVSSPAINRLKGTMQARHQRLVPFYNSGAVGMTSNGLVALRDPKAVSLKDRGAVSQLVGEENADRNVLYGEIARANGHPEWEREVRTIFDRRWVANAPGGWWFQNANGDWVQK